MQSERLAGRAGNPGQVDSQVKGFVVTSGRAFLAEGRENPSLLHSGLIGILQNVCDYQIIYIIYLIFTSRSISKYLGYTRTETTISKKLPRRLAYGILWSTSSQDLPPVHADWKYPPHPVPAWKISCTTIFCSSSMDANANSRTTLPSGSGMPSPEVKGEQQEKQCYEEQRTLDNIHVLQHFEPLEMITGFETNNRYDIKNNTGQMVYFVTEDTDDYTRNAYRTLRPFVLRVTDCMGREVMTMQRPFRCTCCCFCCPSARQELEVQCPPGVTIGFVAEHWNLCRAVYSLQNEKKEDMMGVLGPCSTYGCGSDSVFEILSLDGVSIIGSITRKWNGVLSAMSDADHFEIHFPLDLDVTMKAMIFGACFLIVSLLLLSYSERIILSDEK
ncbi:hypothetical protein E5288_WYG013876 [Bos mutus]|uniref:Phospholipid scramblase n=1 Tax=Bos mutus TaxID=72004 RepID=A0A6B0RX54_9CETA|nr:hypothetical protein [Bos mutus]